MARPACAGLAAAGGAALGAEVPVGAAGRQPLARHARPAPQLDPADAGRGAGLPGGGGHDRHRRRQRALGGGPDGIGLAGQRNAGHRHRWPDRRALPGPGPGARQRRAGGRHHGRLLRRRARLPGAGRPAGAGRRAGAAGRGGGVQPADGAGVAGNRAARTRGRAAARLAGRFRAPARRLGAGTGGVPVGDDGGGGLWIVQIVPGRCGLAGGRGGAARHGRRRGDGAAGVRAAAPGWSGAWARAAHWPWGWRPRARPRWPGWRRRGAGPRSPR